MSQCTISHFGDYSLLDLTISKVGKLGIEFRQASSPYFVVKISPEAEEQYSVQPGDLLVGIRSDTDSSWTETDDLEWTGLIAVLRNRPVYARFKRFNLPSSESPKKSDPLPDHSPRTPRVPESPPQVVLKSESHMVPIAPDGSIKPPVVPGPARPVSPKESSDSVTVLYPVEGSLGLEFEETDFPFRVSAVVAGSMSSEKGIWKGDCLVSVNGKRTEGMDWTTLRNELIKRPAVAIFEKNRLHVAASASAPSVWGLAAGLLKQATSEVDGSVEMEQERLELRRLIDAYNAEDIESLKQRSLKLDMVSRQIDELSGDVVVAREELRLSRGELQNLRTKNSNLIQVMEEMETSHSAVVMRFESALSEQSKKIAVLNSQLLEETQKTTSHPIVDSAAMEMLDSTIAAQEARIELLEKDNSRLRKENVDLGNMVQQCLEKIQKDLADKPHWVDRRVVCAALRVFLKETADPHASAEMHAVARQRLGDVLGLTLEERTAMGLLTVPVVVAARAEPSFGENFVSFLEHEIQPPESH